MFGTRKRCRARDAPRHSTKRLRPTKKHALASAPSDVFSCPRCRRTFHSAYNARKHFFCFSPNDSMKVALRAAQQQQHHQLLKRASGFADAEVKCEQSAAMVGDPSFTGHQPTDHMECVETKTDTDVAPKKSSTRPPHEKGRWTKLRLTLRVPKNPEVTAERQPRRRSRRHVRHRDRASQVTQYVGRSSPGLFPCAVPSDGSVGPGAVPQHSTFNPVLVVPPSASSATSSGSCQLPAPSSTWSTSSRSSVSSHVSQSSPWQPVAQPQLQHSDAGMLSNRFLLPPAFGAGQSCLQRRSVNQWPVQPVARTCAQLEQLLHLEHARQRAMLMEQQERELRSLLIHQQFAAAQQKQQQQQLRNMNIDSSTDSCADSIDRLTYLTVPQPILLGSSLR